MKTIITLATLSTCAAAAALTAPSCSVISPVTLTFYGWPDNDPPSADIAYDCGRGYTAGGTGTLEDPLTAASAPGEFSKCEVIYVPYLQKYVRIEDTCAQCMINWRKRKHHVDIWMGPLADEGNSVMECENRLTPQRAISVIRKPREGFRVDESPLYASGCHAEDTYDAFEGCSGSDPGNESRPETGNGDGAESGEDEDKDDEMQTPQQSAAARASSMARDIFDRDMRKDSTFGLLVLSVVLYFYSQA